MNISKIDKIEMAPTDGVDFFTEITNEFMMKVFEMEPGDYLISDESSLWDFSPVVSISDAVLIIKNEYNLDLDPDGDLILVDIFRLISNSSSSTH